MEKMIFDYYNVETTLAELVWPEQRQLIVAYCRVDTPNRAEDDFAWQREVLRRVCNKVLGRNKYHVLWVNEIADGDLPARVYGQAEGQYRPGLTLAISVLLNTTAAHLVATDPALQVWIKDVVLPQCDAVLLIPDGFPARKHRPSTDLDALMPPEHQPAPVPSSGPTAEQIAEAWDMLAWTDGSLDEAVYAKYGIDPAGLPLLMQSGGYAWNGAVWTSVRPVWSSNAE